MRKLTFSLLILLLAACVPVANPEPEAPAVVVTVAVDRPTPPPPPTTMPAVASLTPTMLPVTPSTTTTPLPPPTAVASFGSPLPENLALSFNVIDQLGGSAHAVFATAEHIYLGMGPRLLVFDTSLNLLGESAPFAGIILDIAVEDNVAYLALGSSGMTAVDVSDPANPTSLGGLEILHSVRSYIDTVTVSSSGLILRNSVNGQTSMIQVDVSNPAEPVQTLITVAPSYANLTVTDTAVYAVAAESVSIYDPVTSDLTAPVATLPVSNNGYGLQLLVRDNLAYLLQSGGDPGVQIYDVAKPRQPQAIGNVAPIGGFAATQAVLTANGLVTFGNMGEFGFCGTSFSAALLEDPLQPQMVDGWDEPNCVYDIATSPDGRFLYSAGQQGLRVYDVGDLAAPMAVGHYQNPFHVAETAVVLNNRVYAITPNGSEYSLSTASLSDGNLDFTSIESVPLPNTVIANLLAVDNILLASRWVSGLSVLDASQPAVAPEIQAQLPIYGDRYANVVGDGIFYAPIYHNEYQNTVVAYDVSEPTDPTRLGLFDLGLRTINALAYENGRLFITSTGDNTTLTIVDASDPANMTQLAETILPLPANRLAVSGDTVFVACPWECADLFIFDAADLASPALLATHTLPRPATSLTYDPVRQLLYTTAFRDDTLALDVSDPVQPVIVGATPIGGQITVMEDGLLLIAAEDGGLYTVLVTR